jgi:hypothetical protein
MSVVLFEEHNFDDILAEHIQIFMEEYQRNSSHNYIEQITSTVDVLKIEKGYSYEKIGKIFDIMIDVFQSYAKSITKEPKPLR